MVYLLSYFTNTFSPFSGIRFGTLLLIEFGSSKVRMFTLNN